VEEGGSDADLMGKLPRNYVDLRSRGMGIVLDFGWRRTEEGLRWERDQTEKARDMPSKANKDTGEALIDEEKKAGLLGRWVRWLRMDENGLPAGTAPVPEITSPPSGWKLGRLLGEW
jgi:hypothetical protein